ncbi:MAG: FecR domain-containing protein [Candidatus Riflebacteria bacterium]|nr:FecR domain-containing protein [Candidatus Riflebacteria bacterium]
MNGTCEKLTENLIDGNSLSTQDLHHVENCLHCKTAKQNVLYLCSQKTLFNQETSGLADKIFKVVENLDSPFQPQIQKPRLFWRYIVLLPALIAAVISFFYFKDSSGTTIPERKLILPMNNYALLPDGSQYRVKSLSECEINERSFQLYKGAVEFIVKSDKKGFQVKTPLGEIRVIGTNFIVNVDTSKLKVDVNSGKVMLIERSGAMSVVSAGESYTARASDDKNIPSHLSSSPSSAFASGTASSSSTASGIIFESGADVDFPTSK